MTTEATKDRLLAALVKQDKADDLFSTARFRLAEAEERLANESVNETLEAEVERWRERVETCEALARLARRIRQDIEDELDAVDRRETLRVYHLHYGTERLAPGLFGRA